MNEKTKRLGDAELEIMSVIWQSEEVVTSNYILEKLKGQRDWKLSSLMTSLSRLAEKGFVYCNRTTRTNLYSEIITESEYKAKESKSFLKKLYGNSIQSLIGNLYDNQALDKVDILELRKYLDELEQTVKDKS